MIISLDIPSDKHVEHMFRRYPRAVYGLAFAYVPDSDYCGYLAQGEDLYLTGHGTPQSIGHPEGRPRFEPGDLCHWLRQSVLPCGYFGDLYIAAPGCTAGFLAALRDSLGYRHEGRVFGHFDPALSSLPTPVSSNWVSAA
ncbi:hypothetical protein [Haliea sp. E17]|uniref:hypothetical protein n=1 Tax=Haliea sp. E17 TaxID=3401576 RepID=UPI003AAC925B